jgi:hypothetical protein
VSNRSRSPRRTLSAGRPPSGKLLGGETCTYRRRRVNRGRPVVRRPGGEAGPRKREFEPGHSRSALGAPFPVPDCGLARSIVGSCECATLSESGFPNPAGQEVPAPFVPLLLDLHGRAVVPGPGVVPHPLDAPGDLAARRPARNPEPAPGASSVGVAAAPAASALDRSWWRCRSMSSWSRRGSPRTRRSCPDRSWRSRVPASWPRKRTARRRGRGAFSLHGGFRCLLSPRHPCGLSAPAVALAEVRNVEAGESRDLPGLHATVISGACRDPMIGGRRVARQVPHRRWTCGW